MEKLKGKITLMCQKAKERSLTRNPTVQGRKPPLKNRVVLVGNKPQNKGGYMFNSVAFKITHGGTY